MVDIRLTNQVRSQSKNLLARRHTRIGRRGHGKEVPRRLLVQQIKQNAIGELDNGRALSLVIRVLRGIARRSRRQVRVAIRLERQV